MGLLDLLVLLTRLVLEEVDESEPESELEPESEDDEEGERCRFLLLPDLRPRFEPRLDLGDLDLDRDLDLDLDLEREREGDPCFEPRFDLGDLDLDLDLDLDWEREGDLFRGSSTSTVDFGGGGGGDRREARKPASRSIPAPGPEVLPEALPEAVMPVAAKLTRGPRWPRGG